MSDLGYVVIVFNQASGQPDLAGYGLFDTFGDAEVCKTALEAETRETGRRERYTVAAVTEVVDADAQAA